MVSNDIPMEECIETIVQTLPACKERGVAYSTFSVIHINNNGKGYMFEFDNPKCIFLNNGAHKEVEREELNILNKKIYKTNLELENQDVILLMSDGVPHAGIGKTMNFGWQRDDIIEYLEKNTNQAMSARCIANILASASEALYLGEPGDDTTVAAIKIRQENQVNTILIPF